MKNNNSNKNDVIIKTYESLKVFIIIAAHVILVLAIIFYPKHLPLWEFNPGDIVMMLLGLFVVALFIERSVEVIMIISRDRREKEFQAVVNDLKEQLENVPDSKAEEMRKKKKKVDQNLNKHKAVTKTLAMYLIFVVGIIASVAGLRALQPLVDMTVFKGLSIVQRTLFVVTDIIITGALLGGGSKGIHELVEAVLNTVELYRTVVKKEKTKTEKKHEK